MNLDSMKEILAAAKREHPAGPGGGSGHDPAHTGVGLSHGEGLGDDLGDKVPADRLFFCGVFPHLLAARVNVANMSLNRSSKGGSVMMIIETDDPVPAYMVELIEKQPGIRPLRLRRSPV